MKYNVLLCCALLFFVLSGCQKHTPLLVGENADLYDEYILAHSPGSLKWGNPFVIDFAREVGGEGKEVSLNTTPALKGTLKWLSKTRLSFQPNFQNAGYNKRYTMTIDLKSLYPEISQKLRYASFSFQCQPAHLSLKWELPRPERDRQDFMYLQVTLTSVEDLTDEQIKNLFRFEGPAAKGAELLVSRSQEELTDYNLRIVNIERQEAASELSVRWEVPEHLAGTGVSSRHFSIPAKGDFAVLGFERISDESNTFRVYFSDFLDAAQDIAGLVMVDSLDAPPPVLREREYLQLDLSGKNVPQNGNIRILGAIRAFSGKVLKGEEVLAYSLQELPPQVRFLGKGSILPYADVVVLPFEAMNLEAVDVEVFKIFSNNVLYDLHFNFSNHDDSYGMARLGRVVARKKIDFRNVAGAARNTWRSYGVDLTKLIVAEPGAFYELRLSFRPDYVSYACPQGMAPIPDDFYRDGDDGLEGNSSWRDYPYYNYGEDDFNYSTSDPCKLSYYYSEHFDKRNFLASNLALSAKAAESGGDCYVYAYDIQTGKPVEKVRVKLLDAQLQVMAEGLTDVSGMIKSKLGTLPKFATAAWNNHHAYLELKAGKSLSQSEFDIDGAQTPNGLKASVYAERGVWRPGDTIHFNIILFDDRGIPDKFPVSVKLTNPLGKIVYQRNLSDNLMGLYSMKIPTADNDITGSYIVSVQAGLLEFQKTLQIETIKPNNIKVNWSIADKLDMNDLGKPLELNAEWLLGYPAAGLKASVALNYRAAPPVFPEFREFSFVSPEAQMPSGEIELHSGVLDEKGKLSIPGIELPNALNAGNLNAKLITKVTEASGQLSVDYFPFTVQAFEEYVGIKIPNGLYGGKGLEMGKEQEVSVIVLDRKGNPVKDSRLTAELFEVSSEWWWEVHSGDLSDVETDSYKKQILKRKLLTDKNGKASLKIKIEDYGRYFVRIVNDKNQYTTGDYFYCGWSFDQKAGDFVNILPFKSGRDMYRTGETAKINLPGAETGHYVVNIIRGNSIIKSEFLPAKAGNTLYSFGVTSAMAPNVYVDVCYIQGNAKKLNELPLRMYGVIPLLVEEPSKKLHPVIHMSDVIRTDEAFTVEIAEESGREMAYRLFLVDEGLLNLTRFKTPDPHADLMAKEALALMTWDNFDAIMTKLNPPMEWVTSIGGDVGIDQASAAKLKRFKPVVLEVPPTRLARGARNKHQFTIHNYSGAIRAMVVANTASAAGAAEKQVPVRKELMVQLALPASLSYLDELEVPVTVFVTEGNVRNVNLSMRCEGPLAVEGSTQQKVSLYSPGEQVAHFKVRATGKLGLAKIYVEAKANAFRATHELPLPVVNPNPVSRRFTGLWVEAGKSADQAIEPYGMPGTQHMTMEVSTLQGFPVRMLADKLIAYPHGCLEQTISTLFPQCLLGSLVDLSSSQRSDIAFNIRAGLEKLRRFQLSDGSFAYWPGQWETSDWNTSYAGHFMIAAKKAGFSVPADMLENWHNYQKRTALKVSVEELRASPVRLKVHAYRLFTLAFYGQPAYAPMNVLHQSAFRGQLAEALLAASYWISGKSDVARAILKDLERNVPKYRENEGSFGSAFRDEALIAQMLAVANYKTEASEMLNRLLKIEKEHIYLNTQEMSFLFQAVAAIYGGALDQPFRFSYALNGNVKSVETSGTVYQVSLDGEQVRSIRFENKSGIPLSVNFIQTGVEPLAANVNEHNGIKMNMWYEKSGKRISVYKPGDEIEAIVELSLEGFTGKVENVALNLQFPNAFEVINTRIGGIDNLPEGIDYQDFRDNQVKSYFSLTSPKILRMRFPAHITFSGKFSSPLSVCEAMYDPALYARVSPPKIEIQR